MPRKAEIVENRIILRHVPFVSRFPDLNGLNDPWMITIELKLLLMYHSNCTSLQRVASQRE